MNTVYENVVLEAKAKDLLTTAVNTRSLMTIDNSLSANAGMTKTVITYTYDGEVEELGIGEGNTGKGEITHVDNDYTVKMNQQRFHYYDEEYMKDNTIVDNLMKGANQQMVNKMTADFIGEVEKATLSHSAATFGYETIVDAISKLNIEDETTLFVVAPTAWKAELRKDEDYKAAKMGEVVYSGQTATVSGLPVIYSNALTNAAYVMNKDAITLYMKKDVEVEQERIQNERDNIVYLRTAYVVALTDATKIVKIVKAA